MEYAVSPGDQNTLYSKADHKVFFVNNLPIIWSVYAHIGTKWSQNPVLILYTRVTGIYITST